MGHFHPYEMLYLRDKEIDSVLVLGIVIK